MNREESEYLRVVRGGLARATRPSRVVVLGAGMAGLVAAHELLRAGHEPVVLEARHRVGGRVHTLREPFAPGLRAEAGAMRVPVCHRLTMAYIERFGLRTTPFSTFDPATYVVKNGERYRRGELDWNALFPELGPSGQTLAAMLDRALEPAIEIHARGGMNALIAAHDGHSLGSYLRAQGFSEAALEAFGVYSQLETLLGMAFLEFVRDHVEDAEERVQLADGMDSLPRAFLPTVGAHIRYGARVVAIEQDGAGVTVHCANRAGRFRVRADRAIVTLPFAVLRHIEIAPHLSPAKRRAIRQVSYAPAGKIFFQCRRRFWEDEGIRGGSTVTDLPIRGIYYPEHGRETGRGVLLGSYTWAQDAQRWGALSPDDRLEQALENLAVVHPAVTDAYEVGTSVMWQNDELAGGAFAMLEPGQQRSLREAAMQIEGRIHFAGEHTALRHRWIQGAIESGLRAAMEVTEGAC